MISKQSNLYLKEYAYVVSSTYRCKAILGLNNNYLTHTYLAKISGIRTNHISKVLRELKAHGLAVCINEDARKGRLYHLTELGMAIMEDLKAQQGGID